MIAFKLSMFKTKAAFLLLLPLAVFAAPSGPAESFAVLAGASVSCTDSSIIGSVGAGTAITQSKCPISGTIHKGDTSAISANRDFLSRYDSLALKSCGTVLTGTLAGQTLKPGTYCFDAGATLTGKLTLDGTSSGVWTFKVGAALTATNFSVVMAGGAKACNATWVVADSATLTTSTFQGNILSRAAGTITGGSLTGNLSAKTGVTMTNTKVTGCAK